jgi:nucleotide-binding universal stress UspA family protein
MSGPIVCGVDDSAGARDALTTALDIAERTESSILLVHVAPDPPRLPGRDPERRRRLERSVSLGTELLERATVAVTPGREVTTRVALGDPAEQLAAAAASSGAEMVVVGSRGRRRLGAALLGSVSRTLTGLCDCPVLVVPPGATLAGDSGRGYSGRAPSVLCGIDESPESVHAAIVGSRLAGRLGDRLVLVHVHPPLRAGLDRRYAAGSTMSQWKAAPALLAAAADATRPAPGPEVELRLEPGEPRAALVRAARRENAELLVLGSHPDRPILRRSVTARLLARSPIPTLVVSPPVSTTPDGG